MVVPLFPLFLHCGKNINNIDLLLRTGHGFRQAVALLQDWLRQYRSGRAGVAAPATSVARTNSTPVSIGTVLRREFGNRGPDG